MQKIIWGVLLLLVVVLTFAVDAKRGGGRSRTVAVAEANAEASTKADVEGCSAWTFGPCTLKGNKTCGRGSKLGSRTGENCPLTQKSFRCKVKCGENKKTRNSCRYGNPQVSECDVTSGKQTLTLTLSRGDTNTCPATKVIQKNCRAKKSASSRRRPAREAKAVGGRREGGGRRQTTAVAPVVPASVAARPAGKCKYQKASWSECDVATNTRTKTLTLKPGSRADCQPTKVVTKKCKKPRTTKTPRIPRTRTEGGRSGRGQSE